MRVPSVRLLLAVIVLVSIAFACADRELRGKVVDSVDGRTYLVVADANGGECGQITLDGRPWPHAIRVPGEITPGLHRIACGDSGEIEFTVPAGTTFHFDYWGP